MIKWRPRNMKRRRGEEELKRKRARLEAMSHAEWDEAVASFWMWFEKLRSWDEARDERPTRRIGPSSS